MTPERPFADDGGEPTIDLAHLAAQTLGDQALEVELLNMFDCQSAKIVARLTALSAGDAKASGDLAHTLKGSALAIGAGRVARAAGAYEAACVAGSLGAPGARAALGELNQAVAEARAAIAGLFG